MRGSLLFQSILSFSHGQLRPHGEEEGTGEEGKEARAGAGGPGESGAGTRNGSVWSRASGKGAVKGAELAFRDTGAAEGSGDEEATGGEGREEQRFCGVEKQSREGG